MRAPRKAKNDCVGSNSKRTRTKTFKHCARAHGPPASPPSSVGAEPAEQRQGSRGPAKRGGFLVVGGARLDALARAMAPAMVLALSMVHTHQQLT